MDDITLGDLLITFVLFLGAVLLIVLFFIPLSFVVNEEGYQVGRITGVSKRGIIAKKYQVFLKTDRESSNDYQYCIEAKDNELADKLKIAMKNEQKVALYSYDKFITGIINPACEYDEIYKFEVIK